MANKEFQARHGLIVNNNLLIANVITNNVAVNGNVFISNTLAFGPFQNTKLYHSGNTFVITTSSANVLVMNPNTTGVLFDVVNTVTSLRVFSVTDFGNVAISGDLTVNGNISFQTISQTIFIDQTTKKVGIGKSAPTANLDVVGTANIVGDLTVTGNVNFDNATLYVDAANSRVGINDRTPNTALCVTGIISSDAFYENPANITTSYTITTGRNAMSAGPITINSGVTITVPSNSTWTIV